MTRTLGGLGFFRGTNVNRIVACSTFAPASSARRSSDSPGSRSKKKTKTSYDTILKEDKFQRSDPILEVSTETSTKGMPPWFVLGKHESLRAPNFWWKDLENQRRYLDWLGDRLGYTSREDWYQVSQKDFLKNHGGSLLMTYYASSPAKAIRSIYSDFNFLPWLFSKSPGSTFNSREVRREYIDWLVKKVAVRSTQDLTVAHFMENGGANLMTRYKGSPLQVLNSLTDDISENIDVMSLMTRKPRNFWKSMSNQRAILDKLGESIGVRNGDLSPWYEVTAAHIKRLGAEILLLNEYNNSISEMVGTVYPEYNWEPWKFKRTTRRLSREPSYLKEHLEGIENALGIFTPEDWYRISEKQLIKLKVFQAVKSVGTLVDFLRVYRPNYPWDESKFVGVSHFRKRITHSKE